jgi:hypothetical protein
VWLVAAGTRTLAEQFRAHASRMQGLYRVLLYELADDCDAGGVVRYICRDWAQAPATAVVQLRLLAGVHRLALSGRAPELVPYYPNLGGTADPGDAWPVFRRVLAEHAEQLARDLDIAPQTNEPGRSAPLLAGILDAVRRSGLERVRLLEPGASAGLNLLVDRFRIGGQRWWSGPPDSPLSLAGAVLGATQPVDYTVVARRGCDLAPVDPATEEGRLRLTSFVWPHHVERFRRLQAALRIAAEHPVTVDRASAGQWLADQLAEPVADGVLTVVWHSITRQYWPEAEIAVISEVLDTARNRMPIAHIAMEFPASGGGREGGSDRGNRGDSGGGEPQSRPAELTVRLSVPGGPADPAPVLLGTVADHGVPVRLASPGHD